MGKYNKASTSTFLVLLSTTFLLSACGGGTNFLSRGGVPLKIEEVSPSEANQDGGGSTTYQDIPSSPSGDLSPIFNGVLGMPISYRSLAALPPDPSGYTAVTDYDGDGIPNEQEVGGFYNPYVSDCPRISARIDTPVTLELRVSETDVTENHSEDITDTDVKKTINNSMESKQYNQLNKKTTPYVVKNSNSTSVKDAGSEGYNVSSNANVGVNTSSSTKSDSGSESSQSAGAGGGFSYSMNQNRSWDRELAQSSMSEKTVFEDVSYIDNLNRNGVEYKNDTVQRVSKNFRQSALSKSTTQIGPSAGYVRAGMYLANESQNQPVRISNVICTLSFRTPSGKCLPVKTFRLKNDDNTEFDQEVYGGEDRGPYTINVESLNTFEVKNALRCGYIPQIHVVSYDMHRVEDSNYNPGVDNLKVVEETAKARTAIIKIAGNGMRETYRVPAFDVDAQGNISPGISLKKALFRIYAAQTGGGERWERVNPDGTISWEHVDLDFKSLTVPDNGLKWRADFDQGAAADGEYRYDPGVESMEITGNRWSKFSTYLKTYVVIDRDSSGRLVEKKKRIETIERIGSLKKYNPFTSEDNPAYDPNEPLSLDEFYKMKYWIVLHNGRYYEGDLNDPIWAGERYEIVLFDGRDFNEHFKSFYYAPLNRGTERDITSALDTQADFILNTLWNRLTNDDGELSRALYLGRVVAGDVVKLEVQLDEFRSLFNVNEPGKEFGDPARIHDITGRFWQKFNYTFDTGEPLPTGIPASFIYKPWGGYNSIDLWIEKSANAHFYTVSFWRSGETESTARIAYLSSAAINESDGFVTVNRHTSRHTKDAQGNDVPGAPLGLIGPEEYLVKVRAHGVVHNVPASTLSGAGMTSVSVSDPSAFPGLSSRISAEGSLNTIDVMIEQAQYAEYYFIDIEGPLNYGWGNGRVTYPNQPTIMKIGHIGMNRITIPNLDASAIGPEPLTSDEENRAVPGVYHVTVSPVNKNLIDADGNAVPDTTIYPLLGGEPATVLVDYNRYMDQRYDENNQKYAPRLQFEEFGPKDVDLEVNFNDGSGWFRLKLSHDDVAADDKVIDCRYTTNFVSSHGRVVVYFSAPTGPLGGGQNSAYDVFRGGAEEVDVYLRTVAKPEYRDSLWLKQSAVADTNLSRRIYVNSDTNGLPDCDPLKYWIARDETDATLIEDYTASDRVFCDFNAFLAANSENRIAQNDFGLVSGGKKDFFFSPMKNLTYNISASLVEADLTRMMKGFTHVDNPEYRAMGGEYLIKLSNLDTQYGEKFRISLARAALPTEPLFEPVEVSIDPSGPHTYEITPELVTFIPNQEYLVCIEAANTPKDGNGAPLPNSTIYSSKVYRSVKPGPQAVAIPMADPKMIQPGYWSFADPAQSLLDDSGRMFVEGLHFRYCEPLNSGAYNLYDPGADGGFSPGRYFRIVHNGKNIADPTGLNLTPVAMNLSQVKSPLGAHCYIDPTRGTFSLPRPIYWSRLNSLDNISVPEILDGGYGTPYCVIGEGTISTVPGKFSGNALRFNMNPPGYWWTYPLGNDGKIPESGTLSCWIQDTNTSGNEWFNFFSYTGVGQNVISVSYLNQYGAPSWYIYILGSYVYASSPVLCSTWTHVYIVWDKYSRLSSSKSIRVFANGTEIVSTTLPITNIDTYNFRLLITTYGNGGHPNIDNLKIWNHVVSEDPSWEYNNGSGREDALHPVYAEANGYKPLPLNSANSGGVGYYGAP